MYIETPAVNEIKIYRLLALEKRADNLYLELCYAENFEGCSTPYCNKVEQALEDTCEEISNLEQELE
jgi:hypothetical protein